jgi:rod shape-determining protein MreC
MAALVIALFIWLSPRFIMEPLRFVMVTIAWPIQNLFSSVAFQMQGSLQTVLSIGDLKRENDRLLRENIRLSAESARWQSVQGENNELRKELELLPRENYILKGAEVIGRDAAGLGNWITIDQGSFQGIERGMPVIVYGAVLIGRVTEVFPESSRVMLISNPESVVSGVTAEGGAQGIVKGEYGLGIIFDMVLQDASLGSGDRVVTSGLGGEFPKDLVIGTLQNASSSADHLYQRASVVSPVTFDSLRHVFVIQRKQNP